ncbi:MAG: hypothetical protein HYY16_06165 [Planctomycetes bacterium]|nr:hypothetical protein [Planctomycetota bacterium]
MTESTIALVALLWAQDAQEPRVRLTVSIDWEGRDLLDENLVAIDKLREELPDVPITHFLNAAYYTKRRADAKTVTAAIRRALREGDETGLHIHAWRSLVAAAGVKFRRGPTFWGTDVEGDGEVGHEVELEAYNVAELRKIVAKSRAILKEAGFELTGSFRAAGWIAGPKVLEAIRAEGFSVDSSATDAVWHDELERYPLRARIRQTWPKVTAESAPFTVDTPTGAVVEMPDTCALSDYVTAQEMENHILAAVERLRSRDVYVHIGLHQETAARYGRRVTDAVKAVPDKVSFETLEGAARRTGLLK